MAPWEWRAELRLKIESLESGRDPEDCRKTRKGGCFDVLQDTDF
jgi:hypothetical protein